MNPTEALLDLLRGDGETSAEMLSHDIRALVNTSNTLTGKARATSLWADFPKLTAPEIERLLGAVEGKHCERTSAGWKWIPEPVVQQRSLF